MSWLQVVWLDHYSMLGYFLYTVVLGSEVPGVSWAVVGENLMLVLSSYAFLGHFHCLVTLKR